MLRGWTRVALAGTPYPTLRRRFRGQVGGAVLTAPAGTLARLQAYEGPRYRLMPVVVRTGRGNIRAHAWIATAGACRTRGEAVGDERMP
jgi:Gamma-glutamyl cyclotransferase, AIG2-like